MTISLRERAEADLEKSLEGEWGLPVELITPDGVTINTSENDGEALMGQVLYDSIKTNPDTGEEIVDNNPIVTLRRSSLSRVPAPSEKWVVKIPLTPSLTADLVSFVIDPTRSPEGNRSLGIIRLYLRKAQQSV